MGTLMLHTMKLMFRIPGNIPMMLKVYLWLRGAGSSRTQSLKLALGFWNWS